MAVEELDIKKMKVTELRAALEKRGLSVDGLKQDLINRLQARLDEEEFGMEDMGIASETAAVENKESAPAPSKPEVEEVKAQTPASETKSESEDAKATAAPVEQQPKSGETTTTTKTASTPKDDMPKAKVGHITQSSSKSFEEQKKARALRFGIPVVSKNEQHQNKGRGGQRDDGGARGRRQGRNDGKDNQPRKKQKQQPDDLPEVKLTKEEIEKRLARAEKFGGASQENVDKLKAMLRSYRFESGS